MPKTLMLIVCLAYGHCVHAAEPGTLVRPETALATEIRGEGILTDQTMTPAGHEFYQQFSALWHDKPLQEQFSIAIHERPSARDGNRIRIEHAYSTVFEAVLPAARGNIAATADRAVEIVYERVSAAAVGRLLFHEPDLAADEF